MSEFASHEPNSHNAFSHLAMDKRRCLLRQLRKAFRRMSR